MLACQLISKCQGSLRCMPAILLPHRLPQVWNNRDLPVAQRESQVYRKTGERNSFSCECEEFEDVYLNMHGYRRSATMEISMNQDKITRDLSPIPTYVRNPSSLYVTDMSSDATPAHAFLFKTLFPHSMACKYIVTVRDPIDQVQSHFYYQLGGETSKDKPCSML